MESMISLTLNDRCDRCVQAAKHVARKGDFELMFCTHHLYRTKHKVKNFDALVQDGWIVLTDANAVAREEYNPLALISEPELVV